MNRRDEPIVKNEKRGELRHPEASDLLSPGQLVDRYVIEELIGQGGMATVYRAKHNILGSRHALKLLHEKSATLQESILREGRVQALLDPMYVVPVTDVVTIHQKPALIMPYVEGCSLAELLCEVKPTPGEVAAMGIAICRGVISAHKHGVIHRDLKPSNILLQVKHGHVRIRVADFGLACSPEDQDADQSLFAGTPQYAAPEQYNAPKKVDEKADVWAIGIILYQLLCGDIPFDGPTPEAVYEQIRKTPIDFDPVPPTWRPLLKSTLQQNPSQRLQSVEEVLAALDTLAEDGDLSIHGAVADGIGRVKSLLASGDLSPGTLVGKNQEAKGTVLEPTMTHKGGRGKHERKRGVAYATTRELDEETSPLSLPANLDTFVGRGEELKTLERLLEYNARLVTLLGMGGTGKTRLALRYAQEHMRQWPGGIHFCDLTDARNEEDICRSVASALGMPLGDGNVVDALGRVLAAKGKALVILDNFEQVVTHGAATVGRWMEYAEEVVFLITSRETLSIPEEQTYPLAPLKEAESLELFVKRARKIQPSYAPTQEEESTIEELVALLDHLPLAIELAAARFRILTPRKMLKWARKRFQFLSSKNSKTGRQATLRGTIDWSWNLLTAWEQSALAQLSVFEGGWDMEAMEEVLSLDHLEDSPWPLDVMQSLVEKSLVRNVQDNRFDLFVSVREYAAEKLEELEQEDATKRRHAHHFTALGSPEAIESIYRHGGRDVLLTLNREFDNLMTALRTGIQREAPDIALSGLRAIAEVIEQQGPYGNFSRLVQEVSDTLPLSRAETGELRLIQGRMQRVRGDRALSLQCLEEAIHIGVEECSAALEVGGRINKAMMLGFANGVEEAERAWKEARDSAEHHQMELETVAVILALGQVRLIDGQTEAGVQLIHEGLVRAEKMGNEFAMVKALIALAYGDQDFTEEAIQRAEVLIDRLASPRDEATFLSVKAYHLFHTTQEFEGARDVLIRTLELCDLLGAIRRKGITYENLGDVELLLGDYRAAREYFEKAVVNGTGAWELIVAAAKGGLCLIAARENKLSEARMFMKDAESLFSKTENKSEFCKFLVRKAQVHHMAGEEEEALETFEKALRLREDIRAREAPLEIHVQEFREMANLPAPA